MNAHYMQGCYLPHLLHLLRENSADIAPERKRAVFRSLLTSAGLFLPALVERAYYGGRVESTPIDKPPVFILGHWRSGTTYLFNLMSQDPSLSYTDSVTTFTCHNYIWLRRILPHFYKKALPGDRVGDDIAFLPDSPQEECYAMANTIDETFTHLITFPCRAEHYMDLAFADGMTPEQQALWKKTHLHMLRKLTYFRKGKRILFKSPDNTAKMYMLHELYPGAKFVNIYRSPYQSVASTINMYREGIRMMTFESVPDDGFIEDGTITFFRRIYTQYFADLERMPSGSVAEISYDGLVRDPVGTLRRVYGELGLAGFAEAEPFIRAHAESQKNFRAGGMVPDRALRDRINSELGFFFEHYGIPMRTDGDD
jgi:hypothetical protein